MDDDNNYAPNLFHHGMYNFKLGQQGYLTIQFINDQIIYLSISNLLYSYILKKKLKMYSYCNSSDLFINMKLTQGAE